MLIKHQQINLKSGIKIEIRSAIADDAESLCRHRIITAGETYYLSRYPEECQYDIHKMEVYLSEKEKHAQDFMITAFINNQIVGELGVSQLREHLKYRHRAYMGIDIQREYCNFGLGSMMVDIAINQAKENGFEQLELGVFEDNERAIHLYEKYGFQKYGIQPRAFKLKDNSYRDEIIMVKML